MKCLNTDEIFLYLEGQLPDREEAIQDHLAACTKCRLAIANRKQVNRAADSLPRMEVPEGFTRKIIALLFPVRPRLRDGLIALGAGFAFFVFVTYAYLAFTGKTLAGFFLAIGRTLIEAVQTIALISVKTYKLVTVGIRVVGQLLDLAFHELARLSSFISLEAQIILVTVSIMGFLSLFYLFRKFLWTGDKA
jgi:predicted anti-sigma-YlaC factor YlaD